MTNISGFTILNIVKKHKIILITYTLKNNNKEIIKCTVSHDVIPKKFRTNNINSSRIRDLGLLDVFDLDERLWRTIMIPCISIIDADGIVYKFKR